MKSGMIKTTIREIRESFGRYIAILAIVMLGVGFFSGLKAAKPAMIATENEYLLQQDFFDLRFLSSIGFTKDDVEKLSGMPQSDAVEGAVSADALCSIEDGNELVYKIHTVPQTISRVVLTAGRMPKRADECLLDAALYSADAIGSKITVTDNNETDTLEMFKERTFTAVGIVRSPYYINFERGTSSLGEGKITAFVYVPEDAFDCDYFTEIFLTAKQKYDVYTDEYEDYMDTVQSDAEDQTKTLVLDRYGEIVKEAQDEIEKAQDKLDEKADQARLELKDARNKILEGEKEIRDGEQEFAEGTKAVKDAEKEIESNRVQLLNGENEIAKGERKIQSGEQEIKSAQQEIESHEQELALNAKKLADGKESLRQAEKKLQKQETMLQKQESKLTGREQEAAQKEAELAGQEKLLNQKETELDGQETALNTQMSQLEQAYAAGYIDQAAYEENKAGLLAGFEQLQAGRKEIEAAKKQVQEGQSQIQAGKKQLQAGKKEIEAAKKQINASKTELSKKKQELLAAESELSAAEKAVSDAKAKLESKKHELTAAKTQLAQGRAASDAGRKELEKAQAELTDAKAELEKAAADLKKGRVKLTDAKAEYRDAKAEFEKETADAQAEIDDARKELANTKEPDYYVLNRNSNIGYACYESDSNIVEAIADVFPVFFFLVAALVCMTTMNRMVEEQRTQIGVLKALGYGNAAIMGKYLFYAGSAALIGAAAGCAGGTWLFPKVIWMGYSIMYSMGEIAYFFDVRLALLSLAAALFCSMGAAYVSCRYELYSVPAALIRPKAPKSGKRIFLEKAPFIWSRMKFLHKVSVRNVVRYKKRFFMMILGIGGCTALLVTGFGIKDSVADIANMQYDEIQIYDINITFAEKVHQADIDDLVQRTDGMLAQAACRHEESVDLDYGGSTKSVYLEIPEDDKKSGIFWDLHTLSGEKIAYPKEGEAVLTAKLAENMGIQAGDAVLLRDNDGESMTVTVSDLCENFVYNYIYISRETYEKKLGRQPEYKSAYVLVNEGVDVHAAAAAVSEQDNVLAVSVTQDMRDRIAAMMESMDYIVLLIIVCAGSLAFIVLYNLTNINITERIREIATIKVLGFYARETADYVFRENLTLTGIGAVAGLGLGKWLHWFVMYQINIDMLSFKTLILPSSCLWSLFYTFCFAMLVNAFMYFKLEKINMAESLKSIE